MRVYLDEKREGSLFLRFSSSSGVGILGSEILAALSWDVFQLRISQSVTYEAPKMIWGLCVDSFFGFISYRFE